MVDKKTATSHLPMAELRRALPLLAALFARVPADRRTGPPVVDAADAAGGVASFDTVLAYENHMLAALLGERQET